MKMVKRNKARLRTATLMQAQRMADVDFAELLQSVQESKAIQRGELRAERRWRLSTRADGALLRERLNVLLDPPNPAKEA